MAFANSKGAFGYQRSTEMDYTCTVRTEDGKGSGWVARNLQDSSAFKPASEIDSKPADKAAGTTFDPDAT